VKLVELERSEWANENPAFRQEFTSRFLPSATENQIAWFNNHCRRTTSPDNGAAGGSSSASWTRAQAIVFPRDHRFAMRDRDF
jgi:hypothetical protein